MKNLICTVFTILTLSLPALAGSMYESFWFEPSIACAIGSAAGYQTAPKGQELNYAGASCALTAGVFYLINSYYENKIGDSKSSKIKELQGQIDLMNKMTSEKAKNRENTDVSIKVTECSDAQELGDGSVQWPTCTDRLVTPKTLLEVGY